VRVRRIRAPTDAAEPTTAARAMDTYQSSVDASRTAHAIAKVPIQATVGLLNGRPLTERGPDLTTTLMRAATVLTARSVFRRN
jgi:hypothetical protein